MNLTQKMQHSYDDMSLRAKQTLMNQVLIDIEIGNNLMTLTFSACPFHAYMSCMYSGCSWQAERDQKNHTKQTEMK